MSCQPFSANPDDIMKRYSLLARQAASLIEGCPLPLPSLANVAALLWETMPNINWAGFYLVKDETLYLGPFQGKTACTVIPFSRGVCGAAASTRQIQIVPDVHQFPGHIACDGASMSEIVLPLIVNGALVGVMDIDSPALDRFGQIDADGLAQICQVLVEAVDWSHGLL